MKEKGNEESEITLHFVVVEKMLSKAGIYKNFAELPHWIVFFFHSRPQSWSSFRLFWDGWVVTLTSASAADAVLVVSASHGLAADPLFRCFYFSFLACPLMSLQAEVKKSCGKSVCKWTLFCPFHYPFFSMYLWGFAGFLLPTKNIFDVYMTYFMHIWGKEKKRLQFSLDWESSSK